MMNTIPILKGLHPGIVLENELKKRQLSKGQFALSIHEFPQTLSAITHCKRGMNTALALKIENALGIEEGYFMTLQVYYEIKQEKLKQQQTHPDLSKLRTVLFWDTDIQKINWHTQKNAVIRRVFERGNEKEQSEIVNFYGQEAVDKVLNRNSA
ncbi:MAG: plasmid maintenance system antidote protein [Bacteroidota bacterium]